MALLVCSFFQMVKDPLSRMSCELEPTTTPYSPVVTAHFFASTSQLEMASSPNS